MKGMERSHLERVYRLSGFLLLRYSAVLEEGYQMKLENMNSLSSLEDNEGERGIYIHGSYLFFYSSASSCFFPWVK
jgi:hypothetical protein